MRSWRCTLESDEPDVVRYVSIVLRDERKGVIAIVRYSYSSKEEHIMCSISYLNTSFDDIEHIMCSITKIDDDELTNLPKDHWRVLAITNAGRSFIVL